MKITRDEYMSNSKELFHDYYSQFITSESIAYIRQKFTIEQLLESKDGHLNDICKISNGGAGTWLWDYTPINLNLARELGETGQRSLPSQSTRTCVGKAVARNLISQKLVTF